jgi:hypothetical protein
VGEVRERVCQLSESGLKDEGMNSRIFCVAGLGEGEEGGYHETRKYFSAVGK